MTVTQYLHAKAVAEREFQEKVRVLDTAWRMIHGNGPPEGDAPKCKRRIGIAESISMNLASLPDEFTGVEVLSVVRLDGIDTGQSAVTNTLKRMARDSNPVLAIVAVGRGKRPTIYRKVA